MSKFSARFIQFIPGPKLTTWPCTRLGGYEILSSAALHRCIRILIVCHVALCSAVFMSFDVHAYSYFTNFKGPPVNLTAVGHAARVQRCKG
jgi:hypothetical protein